MQFQRFMNEIDIGNVSESNPVQIVTTSYFFFFPFPSNDFFMHPSGYSNATLKYFTFYSFTYVKTSVLMLCCVKTALYT